MNKRTLLALLLICGCAFSAAAKTTKALIITGQHRTHNWAVSHLILQDILEGDGYDVDIAVSPKEGEDMSGFNPNFKKYDLVVMDYNGDMWCEEMQEGFIKYVQAAKGGLFLYHAANTIFTDWEEYNKMTALGAFGGRGEQTKGFYTTWKDGQMVKYEGSGVVGHHGKRHDFDMVCRNPNHPAVDPTLPQITRQVNDEIYDQAKGPANIKDVLYTAYSETETGGTGREEILIFTVDYGKARIYHSMIGHVCDSRDESTAMHTDMFVKSTLAGARWASGRK
ncbi:MAG: ThuA domain-containing protein [Rikenellaceae bacterium]